MILIFHLILRLADKLKRSQPMNQHKTKRLRAKHEEVNLNKIFSWNDRTHKIRES